jgi:4a-hydroxytetrahydrobiopterin dehydratase
MKQLSNEELENIILDHDGWILGDGKLIKEYSLSSFSEALAFVVKVGIEAEKLDHHPDILLHSWNKVKIALSTHSANGITDLDINLAKQIEIIKK